MEYPTAISDLVSAEALSRYGDLAAGGSSSITAWQSDRRNRLAQLSTEDLANEPLRDSDMAACCLSGLWLLHGELDPSHRISQSIDSAEGSLWHAIMHRLEGDFGNSRYWYRRAGTHAVVEKLRREFPNYPEPLMEDSQPAPSKGGRVHRASMAIAEWQQLFEYCLRQATRIGS